MIAEQRDRASKSPARSLEGAIAPRATEKRRDRASSIHHEMTAPDMARSRRVTLIQGAIAPSQRIRRDRAINHPELARSRRAQAGRCTYTPRPTFFCSLFFSDNGHVQKNCSFSASKHSRISEQRCNTLQIRSIAIKVPLKDTTHKIRNFVLNQC